VKVDAEKGAATEWFDGVYVEEPIFVPAPDATGEDEGVVLATALDPGAERSFLLVLDAESFEERARAWLPHYLPFGFHGRFYRAE
jgi:carotenoid cleavage dioxygenase-like enzyme